MMKKQEEAARRALTALLGNGECCEALCQWASEMAARNWRVAGMRLELDGTKAEVRARALMYAEVAISVGEMAGAPPVDVLMEVVSQLAGAGRKDEAGAYLSRLQAALKVPGRVGVDACWDAADIQDEMERLEGLVDGGCAADGGERIVTVIPLGGIER